MKILLKEILGCGYLDLERALEVAEEAGIDSKELGKAIRDELMRNGYADPVKVAYELILERAERETGIKIPLRVYGNYLDTHFEGVLDEELEELLEWGGPASRFILKEVRR